MAGHRLGALEGRGYRPPFQCIPGEGVSHRGSLSEAGGAHAFECGRACGWTWRPPRPVTWQCVRAGGPCQGALGGWGVEGEVARAPRPHVPLTRFPVLCVWGWPRWMALCHRQFTSVMRFGQQSETVRCFVVQWDSNAGVPRGGPKGLPAEARGSATRPAAGGGGLGYERVVSETNARVKVAGGGGGGATTSTTPNTPTTGRR